MTAPEAIQFTSVSEEQTIALARRVAHLLLPGDLIALHGELGAGKTRFVSGLAAGLGCKGPVSSPTFVLINEYGGADNLLTLIHVDAYRLDGEEDARTIGWDQSINDRTVAVIEWADRVAHLLPDDRLDVTIDHLGPEKRQIVLRATGPIAGRLRQLFESEAHASET